VIVWFLYGNILEYIRRKFAFLANVMTFVPERTVFNLLIPISLIIGIGLGFLGSRITLKHHLNV
jgi:cell division transport system permease protein